MKQIPLTHGKVALVDDEDYEYLSKYKWNAVKSKSGGWHAMATLVMHRIITDAPPKAIVDHIDRDGLNNQKKNLRLTTVAGNAANRDKKKSSKYIGVTAIQLKRGTSYRSYATINGKYRCIGHFDNEEMAAFQRDLAVFEALGALAELNFPERFKEEVNDA